MEKLARVPPEKISRRERRGLPAKSAASEVLSIPDAGICPANLKIIRTTAVIRSFFLKEGVLATFEKNCATDLSIILVNYIPTLILKTELPGVEFSERSF